MANRIALYFGCIVAGILITGCNSRHEKINQPLSITQTSSMNAITNNLGKTVELVGEPVGSKADYGFKIQSAVVAVDSAWDPQIFDGTKTAKVKLLIRADVGWEKGRLVERVNKEIQTRDYAGETIPDHYILRNVKVIKVLEN